MKRLLLCLCAAALLGPLPLRLTAGGEPDYYPLKPGTKLHFKTTVNGVAGKLRFDVSKVEVINGEALTVVEGHLNGKVIATEHLSSNRQGIFRHRFNGMDVVPRVCLLKYPIVPGEMWSNNFKIGNEAGTFTAKVGNFEQVVVPAGTYKTISVTITTKAGNTTTSSTYWFAPNVGMVKQTVNGPVPVLLELEKYEAAK